MRSGLRLLRRALSLFDRHTRLGFAGFALGFAFFAFLDAFALVLVAIALDDTSAIASGASSITLPSSLRGLATTFGLATRVSLVALVALTLSLMLIKSILGAWFTHRSVRFFARHDTDVGKRIISLQLSTSWLEHTERDQSQTERDAVWAPTALVQEFMGAAVLSWAEVCTIIAIGVAVVISNPLVALVGGLYAVGLAWTLQKYVRGRISVAGERSFRAQAAVLKTMTQALSTFKELLVKGRAQVFASLAGEQRRDLADAQAENTYVYSLARYVLEGGLVVGIALVGITAILVDGAASAAASIVFFAAAGFRLLPALQRLQVNLATARYRAPYARTAVNQLEAQAEVDRDAATEKVELDGPRLRGFAQIRGLSFTYPGRAHPALNCVSLDIDEGRRVAVVGPSGAGKTTLADAMLGLLDLPRGSVMIDGVDIRDALPEWRRSVGYVPQEITLVDDTVAANVALGYPHEGADREHIWRALERAHASGFVRELPNGLDTNLGERGVRIAGGQRQRIGIARALYTQPSFLVLDEATSSLDVETEQTVMEAVESLHGEVTVLIVAHRLATVRSADLVVFIEDGHIRAQGTFDEVVHAVPRFAEHARLAGLGALAS